MEEATVVGIAHRCYGRTPTLRRLHSSTNVVYALDFADALPRKVFKTVAPGWADGDIRRDQRLLRALRAHGVRTPAIEHTQEDLPGAATAFTIMPFVGACTLGELPTGSPDPFRKLIVESGRWLAHLHRLDPAAIDGLEREFGPAHDEAEARSIRAGLAAHGRLDAHRELLERAAGLLGRPRTAFIHRDYSPSQVLTDGTVLVAVVDWGAAGYGFPTWDLGLCLAYVRYFWQDEARALAILEGYLDASPLSDAQLREVRLWEAYTVLRLTSFSAKPERLALGESLITQALACA
jgi:Ser/Thr protein kinase RdoA (MazF antagonist)